MEQVFVLMLFIGIGESRIEVEEKLYFNSVEHCNVIAKELSKRYGHWSAKDEATVYCLPARVQIGTPIIKTYMEPPYYPKPQAPDGGMLASTD